MWTFTRPGNPSSLPCLVNHANDGTNPAAQQSQRSENHILATSGDSPCPRNQSITGTFDVRHGSSNVPIEHHPTIRYMVYNNYYKVMSNLPKMGHLPTPVRWPFGDHGTHFVTWMSGDTTCQWNHVFLLAKNSFWRPQATNSQFVKAKTYWLNLQFHWLKMSLEFNFGTCTLW